MKSIQRTFFLLLFFFFLFEGCSSESSSKSEQKKSVILGKLELVNGWARPGSKGQTSGAYLTINNGTASTDTLLSISSNVAQKTELHKSIKNEDGTISMRPAGPQIIRDGLSLQLQPGGLHIMLMKLNRNLAIGDSVSITLNFAHVGKKDVLVPVKIQN